MITLNRLKFAMKYNPESGEFTRIATLGARAKVGTLAGALNKKDGYVRINIDEVMYKRSLLAWMYMTGSYPTHKVDHIDGNKANDKWSNLRAATQGQNTWNSNTKKSSVGIKGIYKVLNNYAASVSCNGKRYTKKMSIDLHTEEECLSTLTTWVRTLRETLHGEFANHG